MSRATSRRSFFTRIAGGIYGSALAHLLGRDLYGAPESKKRGHDVQPRSPHIPTKSMAVIHLFMNGGPSQMDLFDPKPMLDKQHGKPHFEKIAGEIENIKDAGALMRSSFQFARHGQCGASVSDAMPHLAKHVDDIA